LFFNPLPHKKDGTDDETRIQDIQLEKRGKTTEVAEKGFSIAVPSINEPFSV
jgi:hypothetical protein